MGTHLNIYNLNDLPASGLVNYWPFQDSTNDIIGGMDMIIQSNGVLYTDRFSKANSAIRFTNGYGTFPSDSYFYPNTGFTFMAWVNLLVTPSTNARLSKVFKFIKNHNLHLDLLIIYFYN